MAFYSADEMKDILASYPQYQEKLYCRGFLLTDGAVSDLSDYPFYGNWRKTELTDGYRLYLHKDTNAFTFCDGDVMLFLIGHAYDPFSMKWDENDLLKDLAAAKRSGSEAFWDAESSLTGVFCVGYIENGNVTYSTDCCGMQLVYYGKCGDSFYITSHSKLIADLRDLIQDDYITRLVNSRFYHYWGTFLPGDLSPFKELKRVQPNFSFCYSKKTGEIMYNRVFPRSEIAEIPNEEYDLTIQQIAAVLENSTSMITKKWPEKRAAISVTGGRDSTTTLSSAKSVYDKLKYFSYISNEAERVDAEAAHQICENLGLQHTVYQIPDESDLYSDIEIVKKVLECNAGCIGHNNINDVKKRIYLDQVHDFDVEVKSWIDELSRCEGQNKYNTRRFPKKPSTGYYRCMWKVIVNPRLIRESNKVFKEYLEKFYDDEALSFMSWMEYFYWEFSWSSGEGCFLTSEHKYSNDITIPYNNRRLLALMLTVPFEKRMNSQIQIDVIRLLDKRIEESKVYVKDIAHTDFWSFIIRTYLRVFSKV